MGISPAYLSYMINGKRPWRKDLYQRYMGVVNTFVNSEAESVNNKHDSNLDVTQKMALKKAPSERGLLKMAIRAEDINIHLISNTMMPTVLGWVYAFKLFITIVPKF